jgi:6-phosphogluconolactonase
MGKRIHVYPNKEKLATEAAERVINVIGQAIRENGLCNIALAGGKTPREVYSMLATDTYRDQVAWSNLHLFWGDERMVSPEHLDSNFRMVQETLLDRVNIPDGNIHRIRGEIAPEKAANE